VAGGGCGGAVSGEKWCGGRVGMTGARAVVANHFEGQ
jgi:hypothetical protein